MSGLGTSWRNPILFCQRRGGAFPKRPLRVGHSISYATPSNILVAAAQPTSCCTADKIGQSLHPPAALLSCFVPLEAPAFGQAGRCLDPVPLLAPDLYGGSLDSTQYPRCSSSSECSGAATDSEGDAFECVRPDSSAELLRIIVEDADGDTGGRGRHRTLLWSGPREEVWEQGN